MESIDWSKVKKSPLPKSGVGSDADAWYRGSGIKIAVAGNSMTILDDANQKIAEAELPAGFDATVTAKVKDFAQVLLAVDTLKHMALAEPVEVILPAALPTNDQRAGRTPYPEPPAPRAQFSDAFSFLTSSRARSFA